MTDRIRYFGFRAPREMASRFIRNLSDLAHFVQPFVLAAVLKTVCNAWPTARRFRTSVGTECKLGCGAELGDDVVHYPFCPVVAEFIREQGGPSVPIFLRLRSLSHYMLLHYVNIEDLFITAIFQDVISRPLMPDVLIIISELVGVLYLVGYALCILRYRLLGRHFVESLFCDETS